MDYRKMEINGAGSVSGGEYDRIEINGSGKIKGDVKFDYGEINGTCKCLGKMNGRILEVNGNLKVENDIKIGKIEINGIYTSLKNKVYADRINVSGWMKTEGEISADYIEVDGRISAESIVGDVIKIHNLRGISILGFNLFSSPIPNQSCADNIECTSFQAEHICCKRIEAQNIQLSRKCDVEEIYCDGTLRYDASCHIGKINGDCTIISD